MSDDAHADRGYRILVASVPVFIVTYFLLAGFQPLFGFGSGAEKYLLYHWYVFTYVPSHEEVTYDAFVIERAGKPIAPVPLTDSDDLLFDEWRNRPYYTERIRRLGDAIVRQSERVESDRAAIEHHVTHGPITYEVREIRYDPIRKFFAGDILSARTVATFETH